MVTRLSGALKLFPSSRSRRLALGALAAVLAVSLAPLAAQGQPAAPAPPGSGAATAIAVSSGGYFFGTVTPTGNEWFELGYSGGNATITATISYEPTDNGNLSLQVFTGTPASLHQETSSNTRSNNTISQQFSDPSPRQVFLEVSNISTTEGASFVGTVTPTTSLGTTIGQGAAPQVSATEQTAALLPANGTVLGSLGPEQTAWYMFYDSTPNAPATVNLTFSANGPVPDFELYTGSLGNLSVQTAAATVSQPTYTRTITPTSPTWIYFSITDNDSAVPLAFIAVGTPVGTPPSTTTPTAAATATPTAPPSAPTSAPTAPAAPTPTLAPVPAAPPLAHDERYFSQTGYRIDNDQIWSYFQERGQVGTFGYPVSRSFTLLGCQVQIFQRQVAQVCSGQNASLLNLLGPDIFPYTQVNGSTFPGPDPSLESSTPAVTSPTYAADILSFVQKNAPNTFNGKTVNFGSTFSSSISASQAGVSDPNLLPLIDLEVWGAPLSAPAVDPGNSNFIYERFQRGIMMFDASSGQTQGVLLADYLKAIILAQNLPPDLQQEAQGSAYYHQYCPGQPQSLCRPGALSATDLTNAFVQG